MPAFVREHLRPLVGSAGLHLALVAALAFAAMNWTSRPAPVQLAIEGVLVDAKSVPRSALPSSARPPPEPQPVASAPEPAPEPVRKPEEDLKARQAAEQAAARAEAEKEAQAKAEAEAKAAAERQRTAEQQAREKAAAEQKKKAAEDARRKAAEETERKNAEAKAAQDAKDAKVKAEHEADLKRQLAVEEAGAAVARSGAVDEYRSLLVQTIERNWIRPPSARAGLECTLYVSQAPGGTVVDVKLGACNGDQAVRESIANAVYRASPLPAPRDPRAFERRLEIVFKPTE